MRLSLILVALLLSTKQGFGQRDLYLHPPRSCSEPGAGPCLNSELPEIPLKTPVILTLASDFSTPETIVGNLGDISRIDGSLIKTKLLDKFCPISRTCLSANIDSIIQSHDSLVGILSDWFLTPEFNSFACGKLDCLGSLRVSSVQNRYLQKSGLNKASKDPNDGLMFLGPYHSSKVFMMGSTSPFAKRKKSRNPASLSSEMDNVKRWVRAVLVGVSDFPEDENHPVVIHATDSLITRIQNSDDCNSVEKCVSDQIIWFRPFAYGADGDEGIFWEIEKLQTHDSFVQALPAFRTSNDGRLLMTWWTKLSLFAPESIQNNGTKKEDHKILKESFFIPGVWLHKSTMTDPDGFHSTICDSGYAGADTDQASVRGVNPRSCTDENNILGDCYDITIVSTVRGKVQEKVAYELWSTPITVFVRDPKTPKARITKYARRGGEKIPMPSTNSNDSNYDPDPFLVHKKAQLYSLDGALWDGVIDPNSPFHYTMFEPTTTGDGRVLIFQALDKGVLYSVHKNSSFDACDASGWGNFRPIAEIFNDPKMTQYPISKFIFRDFLNEEIKASGDVYGASYLEKIKIIGTYPWIDREGRNILMTMVHSGDGNGFRYKDSLGEAFESNSTNTGVSILGAWTQGKMIYLDNRNNIADIARKFRRDGLVKLYRDKHVRILHGGVTQINSLENELNYFKHMHSKLPGDVVWLINTNNDQVDEIAFDDYLTDDVFLLAHMNAPIQAKEKWVLDGFDRYGYFAENPKVMNSSTSRSWKIPPVGELKGGARVEPISAGGVLGKGLFLDGKDDYVDFEIPVQPRSGYSWYWGVWLDPRKPLECLSSKRASLMLKWKSVKNNLGFLGQDRKPAFTLDENDICGDEPKPLIYASRLVNNAVTQSSIWVSRKAITVVDGVENKEHSVSLEGLNLPENAFFHLGFSFESIIQRDPDTVIDAATIIRARNRGDAAGSSGHVIADHLLGKTDPPENMNPYLKKMKIFINGTKLDSEFEISLAAFDFTDRNSGNSLFLGTPIEDGYRGWVDEFKIINLDKVQYKTEDYCNHALGTIVRIKESDLQGNSDVLKRLSEKAMKYKLIPQSDGYLHYCEQSREIYSLTAMERGEEQYCIDKIRKPKDPLQQERCGRFHILAAKVLELKPGVPRPSFMDTEFCLRCHNRNSPNILMQLPALMENFGLNREVDPRRQPLDPPARIYGNHPNCFQSDGQMPSGNPFTISDFYDPIDSNGCSSDFQRK